MNMKRIQCLACEYESCIKPFQKCSGVVCFDHLKIYSNGTTIARKGCLDDENFVKQYCNPKLFTTCCNNSDFCNDNVHEPIVPESKSFNIEFTDLIIFGTIAAFIIAVLLLFLTCLVVKKHKKPSKPKCSSIEEDLKSCDYKEDFISNFDNSETSGSGLGLPLLTTRTVSKEINRHKPVLYKGRSTEVYKGTWLGNWVAIKVFYTRDEHMFQRELEVYRSIRKHENILEFLGADCISIDACTQQWLITNYYELGSMYDFLNKHTIHQRQYLSILNGLINGLDYLHCEDIVPEIAHRDLKSKNILMKSFDTVCIADFGLAVTYYQNSGKIINGEKYKVGTIRYMPPEILSDGFNVSNFKSHKQADIYSLSLVMWEACRRCISSDGKVDAYSLPFGDVVPNDPTFEDMKKVVCVDDQKPHINSRMRDDPIISRVAKLMEECWYTEPNKRLTSLRVKKTLLKIN